MATLLRRYSKESTGSDVFFSNRYLRTHGEKKKAAIHQWWVFTWYGMYYINWCRILPVVRSIFGETAPKSSSISKAWSLPLGPTWSTNLFHRNSLSVQQTRWPLLPIIPRPKPLGGVVTVREQLGPCNDDMCDEHCIISILRRQFLQCVGALCTYAGVCLG